MFYSAIEGGLDSVGVGVNGSYFLADQDLADLTPVEIERHRWSFQG